MQDIESDVESRFDSKPTDNFYQKNITNGREIERSDHLH